MLLASVSRFVCVHVRANLTSYFSSGRCVCEPAVTGGDSLWFGFVWRLPLCLLEALLDTMAGARPLPKHQGDPSRAPSPTPAHLHRGGCRPRQKGLRPWLCGEGDDPDAIAGAHHRHSVGALVSTAGHHAHGYGGGGHEDKPHLAWYTVGGAVQEQAELHPRGDPAYAEADHRPSVHLCALHVPLRDWVSSTSQLPLFNLKKNAS